MTKHPFPFFLRATAAIAAALLLAACGGGGGSSSSSLAPAPTVTAWPAGTTPVSVNIANVTDGPGAFQQSNRRSPKFVSPATAGSMLTVTQSGHQYSQTVTNLTSGSGSCTSGSPRSCTIPLVLPAGSFTFTLVTYDAAPVSGAIPGTAAELATATTTATIVANSPNSVLFVLSGVVTGTTANNSTAAYASVPANGTTQSVAIAVTATDAGGDTITGTAPYATPLTVTLAETGGSGNSSLVINGTNVGTSGTLTSPASTLALSYNGGGAAGYTTLTTIGGTSTIRVSPMYLAPGSVTIASRTSSPTATITEAGAPASVAYLSPSNTCGSEVTGASVSGTGPSATLAFNTTAAAGYSATCTVTAEDILGSSLAFNVTFLVAGPLTPGTPTFTGGGSGTCGTTVAFSSAGQSAAIVLSDPNFSGAFTAVSTQSTVATASVSGSTVTVTAVAAGATTVNIADTDGNSIACPIGVTTTSGSVQ